jgi:hypothetical protein
LDWLGRASDGSSAVISRGRSTIHEFDLATNRMASVLNPARWRRHKTDPETFEVLAVSIWLVEIASAARLHPPPGPGDVHDPAGLPRFGFHSFGPGGTPGPFDLRAKTTA